VRTVFTNSVETPASCGGEGADQTRTGERAFTSKTPCLQALRGKGPAFEVAPSGCWIWLGTFTSRGYPSRGTKAGSYLVHRRVYEQAIGEIPAGHQVHHRCEEPRCVNPEHLETQTAKEHARLHHGSLCSVFVTLAREQGVVGRQQLIALALERGYSRDSAETIISRAVRYGELCRPGRGTYSIPEIAA
jgi:hypothetical protein